MKEQATDQVSTRRSAAIYTSAGGSRAHLSGLRPMRADREAEVQRFIELTKRRRNYK